MELKSRKKWSVFWVLVMFFSFTVQIKLQAETADTFISPECVALCEEIGKNYSICPELLEAIMETESSGNPKARNGNCKGLMQINVGYHKKRMLKLGVSDIYEERGNILLAADYLAELFREYGDLGTVLMLYNGSSDAIARGGRAEYTEYAKKIMKRAEQLERLHQK